MQERKREANIELLRIIAMFMVVVMHWLNQAQVLPDYAYPLNRVGIAAVVLESLCIVAVNVYVLISGYFLSVAAFSWKRVFRVLAQTVFYTVLMPVLLTVCSAVPAQSDPYVLLGSLFPVLTGQYWFVTAYVVMCLLAPLLNAGLERLEKKQLLQVLGALLLFFSVGKTFLPVQLSTDKFGYDFGWFLVLYLIGGYLRRYGIPFFKNGKRGWGVYLASAGSIMAAQFVLIVICEKTGALEYYKSVPFHYNFLPCLIGAVGLFYAFLHWHIKEGAAASVIRFLSPAVFGVYLLHEQWAVAQRWFLWVNRLTGRLGGYRWEICPGVLEDSIGQFAAVLLVQVSVVFFVCAVVDKARGWLFAKIERGLKKGK